MTIKSLIFQDAKRYFPFHSGRRLFMRICLEVFLCRYPNFAFQVWLRLASKKNIFYPLAYIKHRRLMKRYGLQIWPSTKIGGGLYIGHYCGTIVHPKTIIGSNCNLSQFTTIGSNYDTPAVIGDNVYIGPSVCVVENVHIGSNSIIGAGSVVTKDVPENAVVAGVPAKIISYKTNEST